MHFLRIWDSPIPNNPIPNKVNQESVVTDPIMTDAVITDDPVVIIVDETAPVVLISNPADGGIVSKVVSIQLSATNHVSVARLELYIDGVLSSTVNGASLSLSWNTRKVSDGMHSIEARAFDQANNISTKSIQVQVGDTVTDTTTDTTTDEEVKIRGKSGVVK